MLKKEQKKRNKGKQNEKSKGRKKKNLIKEPFCVVSAKTLYNFLTGKRYTQASEKPHLFL